MRARSQLADKASFQDAADVKVRFCMITSGRTGSNFLCSFLDHAPGVTCHREVYHRRKVYVALDDSVEITRDTAERDRDPVGYLDQLETATFARFPENRACGFKLFLAHNDAVLRHVIADPRYRVVVLRRENVLAQYSSRAIARDTGRWRLTPGERARSTEVVFDAADFGAFLKETESGYRRALALLEAAGKPHFELDYLDINDEQVLVALLEFLDVPFSGHVDELVASIKLTKQNSSTIAERFMNPDDVVSSMKQLGRERWLIEGRAAAHTGSREPHG